jgi:hypothetical protein
VKRPGGTYPGRFGATSRLGRLPHAMSVSNCTQSSHPSRRSRCSLQTWRRYLDGTLDSMAATNTPLSVAGLPQKSQSG